MARYFVPLIVGVLVASILGFILPILSVIIGAFIAGYKCKGGAGGDSK